MAYIGHPLKNDFLYGVREGEEQYMLHAREMEIMHPITGERLKLFSPADFE
jgi:23S rRNA-/tRNA-specific pseudouridylate synthase